MKQSRNKKTNQQQPTELLKGAFQKHLEDHAYLI